MKAIIFQRLFFIVTLVTAVGCSSPEPNVNPEFAEYIEMYSESVISKSDVIVIRLAKQVVDSVQVYKKIEKDLISFSPNVEGELYWVDERTLEFKPSEWLESNREYAVTFKLGELTNVPSELESFTFVVKTLKQDFDISSGKLVNYNDADLTHKSYSAGVNFADVVREDEVQKVLRATQDGKELPVSWTKPNGKVAYFNVDSIERKKERSVVMLHWEREVYGDENETTEIEVLGFNEFGVSSSILQSMGDQTLTIYFSDPLAEQDFRGLLSIEDLAESDFKVKAKNNELVLFFSKHISGERLLTVRKGVKAKTGVKTQNEYSRRLVFEEYKPEVRLVDNGTYIPETNGLIFSFEAVSLSAVDVHVTKIYKNNAHQYFQRDMDDNDYELRRVGKPIATKHINLSQAGKQDLHHWKRYSLDLSKMVKIDPGAIYKLEFRIRPEYSMYTCEGEIEQREVSDHSNDHLETEWSDYYYNSDHYYDFSKYNWKKRDDPCYSAYYSEWNRIVSTRVIASNIGVIAKAGGDKVLDITVTDLITAKPIAGAEVVLLNYHNQTLETLVTDQNGFVKSKLDEKPFLIIAKHKGQSTYLSIKNNQALSTSEFEVGGSYTKKGVNGFIYAERGVWRPGDSIHANFILEDKGQVLPESLPVVAELYNPKRQLVDRVVVTHPTSNFYYFPLTTQADALTGTYNLEVSVGNRKFRKSLPIETIKPNRLAINFDFDGDMVKGYETQKTELHAQWLHGAPVKGLKTKVEMSLYNYSSPFSKWKSYNFSNQQLNTFSRRSKVIFDGNLNDKGKAGISIEALGANTAPGMLKASFDTKVEEPGGGFSENHFTINYSPYSQYVGIHVPKGNLWGNALTVDENHKIDLVLVNPKGELAQSGKAKVKVFRIERSWWWHRSNQSIGHYISKNAHSKIRDEEVTFVGGKATINLKVDKENWGNYIMVVEDSKGHKASSRIYFDWPYWMRANRIEGEEASILGFSTDKDEYKVGEMVKVTFPSNAGSKALVAIENGIKVIDKFWVETSEGETQFAIPTTTEMAPNAFVNVMLLQPHSATANDRPIRQYGYVPIRVKRKDDKLNPVIKTAITYRPEKPCEIVVSEAEGKKMTYTLAVVDEGLLGITNFKTPNPYDHFNQFQALGVRTWDMMDDVVGAYGGELEKLLSLGGDGANLKEEKMKSNRFKSVRKFLGTFTLEPGQKMTHKFMMPNYVGAVRVIVVAGNLDYAYGSEEVEVPVRNPVMVQATLPRVLHPSEEIDLPVTVFAMEDHVKSVDVVVETNDLVEILGSKSARVTFSEKGDKMVYFKARVKNAEGAADFVVKATSGSEKAIYEAKLLVHSPNPEIQNSTFIKLDPGKSIDQSLEWLGVKNTGVGNIEIGTLPSVNLSKRMGYLLRYPYGCLEQNVSTAFPQLYLNDINELTPEEKAMVRNNVSTVLNRLVKFQNTSGSFRYWPTYNSYYNVWSDIYAGHFLVEADRKGYTLPSGIKERWLKQAGADARNEVFANHSYSRESDRNQQLAYRLWVLVKAGVPEIGSMNRLKERGSLNSLSKVMLAAAYAEIGQSTVAEELLNSTPFDLEIYPVYTTYNFGSSIRDEAIWMEALLKLGKVDEAYKRAVSVSKQLNEDSYLSTQSISFALRSMALVYESSKPSENGMKAALTIDGKDYSFETAQKLKTFAIDDKNKKVKIVNNGNDPLLVVIGQSYKPKMGLEEAFERNLKTKIRFTDENNGTLLVDKLDRGTDFILEITIDNPTEYYFNDLALSQSVPSGWEITESSLYVSNTLESSSRYKDVRDDRIDVFYDLRPHENKVFRVRLTAAYSGKYYLPATQNAAMYTDKIQSYIKGKWVEVQKK